MGAGTAMLAELAGGATYRRLDEPGRHLANGLQAAPWRSGAIGRVARHGLVATLFFPDDAPHGDAGARESDTARL